MPKRKSENPSIRWLSWLLLWVHPREFASTLTEQCWQRHWLEPANLTDLRTLAEHLSNLRSQLLSPKKVRQSSCPSPASLLLWARGCRPQGAKDSVSSFKSRELHQWLADKLHCKRHSKKTTRTSTSRHFLGSSKRREDSVVSPVTAFSQASNWVKVSRLQNWLGLHSHNLALGVN